MTRRRLAASVLCLACWLARPAPARAAEPELLLDDGFETYDTRYWCTQPEGVSLADGILRDAPAQGQRWIASNERFLCADLDLTVKFGTLSRDSSIFYYLGFQSISPWVRDVCWVMVQDSVMIVGLKKAGRDGANQPVANVEAGRWYRLSLRWKPSQVEVYLDDLQVFTSAGLRHELSSASRAAEVIPATPLPVFLSANTTRDQPEKAELFVDRVEVRGVRVRKTPRVASAAESSFLRVDRSLGSPGGTRLDVRRGMLRLENRHLLAELDARAGLAWSRLVHRPSGTGCLYESENLPLFMVLGPDFRLDSTDFSVEEVRLGEEGGRRRMDIALAQTAAGVRARLSAVVGPDEQTLWTLRVTNAARVARRLLVVFPILGRVRVGPSLKETHYFYPWRSGIEGTVDCQHIHEYGNLAWMQVMSAFNPERNAGVTVYPRDPTGLMKGLVLKKVSADSEAFVQHSEAVLQTEMPGGEILDFQEGLGLAYYYVPRTLPAGATWSLPETALSVSPGGWKRALQDYSRWAHTWYRGADTPAWFKDCFNYLPAHPPSYYDRDRKRYTCAEGLRGGEHLFQWAYWDDYADNPADRQAYLKPEVYRPGDFEINRERGGLPPFREEVRRIHAAGARFTLYLDHRFCWSGSNAHASHAKDWAAFYAPGQVGSYRTPDEGVMCYYEPNAWADYVARTCGRLVREAGLDGVYLDELGIAFPCYNSAHQHYQRGDWPVPIPLLARHIRLARAAMRAANPEAILMTEHAGSDWLSQFIDGSWVQTYYRAGFPFAEQFYDHDSLIYFRFCFPEFKLAEWGVNQDGWRRCFFNGIGWIGTDYGVGWEVFQVLRENGDAFATLHPEPLVATLQSHVLANRFPAAGKVVYTLYNKNSTAVAGDLLTVPGAPGCHYVELRYDRPVTARHDRGRDTLALDVLPTDVVCLAQLPSLLQARAEGGVVRIRVTGKADKGVLWAFLDRDDSHLLQPTGRPVPVRDGVAELNVREVFGRDGRVILKLVRDQHLLDEVVLGA